MNKKTLIIATSALVASFIFIGVIFYLQTFRTVHIDMKQTDMGVTVYNEKDQEISKLTQSSDIRLQPGNYSIITSGDKYDNTPTNFTVLDKNMTVTVDPQYSAAYRNKILDAELPAITKVIKEAYPTIISSFTLGRGTVYKDGLWYGTTLTQAPLTPTDQGDIYRVVLKKEGDTWIIKAKPALSLSAKEYPSIPVEILRNINAKDGDN